MYSSALVSLAAALLAGQTLAIELTVSKSGGNSSSPLLYGVMFEVRSLIGPHLITAVAHMLEHRISTTLVCHIN